MYVHCENRSAIQSLVLMHSAIIYACEPYPLCTCCCLWAPPTLTSWLLLDCVAFHLKFFFFLLQKSIPAGNDKCQFFFWFHTTFIEDNKYVSYSIGLCIHTFSSTQNGLCLQWSSLLYTTRELRDSNPPFRVLCSVMLAILLWMWDVPYNTLQVIPWTWWTGQLTEIKN